MSALEEFDIRAGGCDRYGDTREQKTVKLARAAIAELEAEVGRLRVARRLADDGRKGRIMAAEDEVKRLHGCIAELEAERDQWKALRDGWIRVCTQHDQINADAAEDLERWADGLLKRAEQAEAALAEAQGVISALERGGVRIVSAGGSWTLSEFIEQIRLARHDAGGEG